VNVEEKVSFKKIQAKLEIFNKSLTINLFNSTIFVKKIWPFLDYIIVEDLVFLKLLLD